MTQQALIAYSIGLLGMILVKILAPGFYARQNIKTPVKVAVFTLVLTQVMNIVFIYGLHLNHAGLALALGLGACTNAGLLYYHLRKAQLFQPLAGWWLFLFKLLLALTVMGLALYYAMGDAPTWLAWSVLERLTHLSGLVVMGIVVYFAVLFVLGFRPQHFYRRTVR